MSAQPEITQRDLRNRSREIMDAIERGQAFTVTRDGHRIGELITLRRHQRFVTREEFATMSRGAPTLDVEVFRADQEAALDSGGRPGTRTRMGFPTRPSNVRVYQFRQPPRLGCRDRRGTVPARGLEP